MSERKEDYFFDQAEKIFQSALLGTDRKPLGKTSEQSLSSDAPEHLLLEASRRALLNRTALIRNTEFTPESFRPAPEKNTLCGQKAAKVLGNLLNRTDAELLFPEFLDYLEAYKEILPYEYLPLIFNNEVLRQDLGFRIREFIGERGKWLAGFRAEWKFWGASYNDLWTFGTGHERREALLYFRSEDAENALALLKKDFDSEPVRERLELLNRLSEGLNIEDELFLENCLNDRSGHVREEAFRLLCLLDGKNAETLQNLLKSKVSVEKEKIITELKESHSELTEIHPGLAKLKSPVKLIIRSLNPDFWLELSGKDPENLLPLFLNSGGADSLFSLMRAARSFHNTRVLLPLLKFAFTKRLSDRSPEVSKATAVLSEKQTFELFDSICEIRNQTGRDMFEALKFLIAARPTPLSEKLSQEVFRLVTTDSNLSGRVSLEWSDTLKAWAYKASPAVFSELSNDLALIEGQLPPFSAAMLRSIRKVMDIRKEMWEAFE